MTLPKRKSPRIPGYDYATGNYYFITICTHKKKCIFGKPEILNELGMVAKVNIESIPKYYPQITVEKFVVMPNHIHMILVLDNCENTDKMPSVTKVVGQYKMSVTKEIHKRNKDLQVWQRSFHDHIIRNQEGYNNIWEYIEYNPVKWEEDCFYVV